MKYAKYREVTASANAYAIATQTGSRNQRKVAEKMVIDWVKKNCSERKKNSVFAVYTRTDNLGSKKWGDYYTAVYEQNISTWRETEKCYISQYGTRILKDSIIGWLSK